MAGATIGTAIGGPVGGVTGTVVGGVIGGLGGRSVAEAVNPTEEEQYWRENHPRQPYASSDFGYEDYAQAYRTGYEGFTKYTGKKMKRSTMISRAITRRTQLARHCSPILLARVFA